MSQLVDIGHREPGTEGVADVPHTVIARRGQLAAQGVFGGIDRYILELRLEAVRADLQAAHGLVQ